MMGKNFDFGVEVYKSSKGVVPDVFTFLKFSGGGGGALPPTVVSIQFTAVLSLVVVVSG